MSLQQMLDDAKDKLDKLRAANSDQITLGELAVILMWGRV